MIRLIALGQHHRRRGPNRLGTLLVGLALTGILVWSFAVESAKGQWLYPDEDCEARFDRYGGFVSVESRFFPPQETCIFKDTPDGTISYDRISAGRSALLATSFVVLVLLTLVGLALMCLRLKDLNRQTPERRDRDAAPNSHGATPTRHRIRSLTRYVVCAFALMCGPAAIWPVGLLAGELGVVAVLGLSGLLLLATTTDL